MYIYNFVSVKKRRNFIKIDRKIFYRKKLKKFAILYGDEKVENGTRYVRYTKIKLLEGLTFEQMLKCIENGELLIDIRIGVYASDKNIGKTHDYGTTFKIHLHLKNLL